MPAPPLPLLPALPPLPQHGELLLVLQRSMLLLAALRLRGHTTLLLVEMGRMTSICGAAGAKEHQRHQHQPLQQRHQHQEREHHQKQTQQ